MKFIYFTDPHLQSKNPRSRRDNFHETTLKKLEEIVVKANEAKAYVICGGDIFNRPVVAIPYLIEVMQVLSRLERKPIFSVEGNHDIFGYNNSTKSRTMYGILETSGLIKTLSEMDPVIVDDTILTGVGYRAGIDTDVSVYTSKIKIAGYKSVHVVHGYLTVNKYQNTVAIDEVEPNSDFILTGHEHLGFGVHEHKGTIFVNPGALLRVSASLEEINRVPKIALIDTVYPVVSLIPLESAEPGEKVLNREEIEKMQEQANKLQEFSAKIESVTELRTTDLTSLIDMLCESEHIESNIKELAMEYINKAKEVVGDVD